jgi:hypothetical protein
MSSAASARSARARAGTASRSTRPKAALTGPRRRARNGGCPPILYPRATIVARADWRWATVEGQAEIIGPDDPHPDIDAEALRTLLRDIFRAAGGTHDDWNAYDQVMAEQRRAAVLITPHRTDSTPIS